MAISSISPSMPYMQKLLPKPQSAAPVIPQTQGGNDGDADDFGGAPDADGARGNYLNQLV